MLGTLRKALASEEVLETARCSGRGPEPEIFVPTTMSKGHPSLALSVVQEAQVLLEAVTKESATFSSGAFKKASEMRKRLREAASLEAALRKQLASHERDLRAREDAVAAHEDEAASREK